MPELPDVEIIKQCVEKNILKQKINDISIRDSRILFHMDESNLRSTISGRVILKAQRHGKHLFLQLSGNKILTMHFGMTGNLIILNKAEPYDRFERASLILSEKDRIAFIDQRILGKIGVTDSISQFITEHSLGADALEISWEDFFAVFHKQKKMIKVALMDQSKIAGIGNVYADEILFQSKVNPNLLVSDIDKKILETVYKNISFALNTAIKKHADRDAFPDKFIIKHRRKNEYCPICNNKIIVSKIDGRSTYYCSNCQK